MEGGVDVVSAPNSVNYGDQLPLGIEAKSQKRLFFPTTGDTYSATGNNICRLDINYDGLLDTSQSVLEFNIQNTTNGSATPASLDIGQAAIKKLTISSGGVVLEEIHDYNTLLGAFLIPAQAGQQTLHYEAANLTGINFTAAFTSQTRAEVTAAIVAGTAAGTESCFPIATVAADPAVAIAATGMVQVTDADIVNGAGSDGTAASAIHTKVDTALAATMATAVTAINNGIIKCVNEILLTGGYGAASAGIPLISADASDCLFTNALRAAVNEYASSNANGTFQTLRYSPTTGAIGDYTGALGAGESRKQTYKLVSGLLDNDKYLPLVLMNAGLSIEIQWATGNEVGCAVGNDFEYQITEVRYAAHLIDLERSFYDRLRMVQQNSGGVLQIAGQSWRGFRGNVVNGSTAMALNCPARVRSLKSFFFGFKRATTQAKFNTSAMGHNNLRTYQLSIGATRYPPTANTCNSVSNISGPYTELVKAFGKVGSTVHSDLCNSGNYMIGAGAAGDNDPSDRIPFSPFAMDLESFRHEIENGIDSSSRALPITLHATFNTITADCNDCYMYVLYDSLFYVNMDGSVSVSS